MYQPQSPFQLTRGLLPVGQSHMEDTALGVTPATHSGCTPRQGLVSASPPRQPLPNFQPQLQIRRAWLTALPPPVMAQRRSSQVDELFFKALASPGPDSHPLCWEVLTE